MRTIRCEHPQCSAFADYRVIIIHMLDNENYKYKHLCAQHYAEEKVRSTRFQYNIVDSIPEDDPDDEAVPY